MISTVKKTLLLATPVVIICGWFAYDYLMTNITFIPSSDEERAAIRAEVAAQDETAFYKPSQSPLIVQSANPINNVYFGDLHIHSSLSADAYLFGSRRDLDATYRFAKGEAAPIETGEVIEITRPLDFAAVTDHAEGFGRVMACLEPATPKIEEDCELINKPTLLSFLTLRANVEVRPLIENLSYFGDDKAIERQYHLDTWDAIKAAAERHNEPGVFTAFAGYEYSPAMVDRGKHHRNVIFRTSVTPDYAVSAYDADSEIDLWKQLDTTCGEGCEFLTIPHNPNKSWGLAFASETIDGIPYTREDWRLRETFEPLVEMFQIKGNSECALGFGTTDEECGFEQFFPVCDERQTTLCIHPTSMARDGLKKGLVLQESLGFNPMKFGLMASTDTHNANPGDTEEWDYRGANSYMGSPAKNRLQDGIREPKVVNPGGLAAVWAPENTRDALFEAMSRREVYATSGTRLALRFFAGADLPEDLVKTGDVSAAYASGVPMGGTIDADAGVPRLFIWATQDPDNAPLAKIQIIKGWLEDGETHEKVFDVACSDKKTDGACIAANAPVDLSDCSWSDSAGTPELRTDWVDPDYDASHNAFYYARVIQIPTCRWTTYDSLRLGLEPPADVPATITEMAWSSPIWVLASD
ncbi:DUF3604 domain-containing protein [Luminiphilus sp.]|nr:DUF3604 domain-containing protein [Luminiphilus sp.]